VGGGLQLADVAEQLGAEAADGGALRVAAVEGHQQEGAGEQREALAQGVEGGGLLC
jgi:hypothetical protein